MNSKPSIAIVFTGGTISMTIDPATGGAVPSLSGEEIIARAPALMGAAAITVHNFGQYPGPHMTPRLMLELERRIREISATQHPDGLVITHGTDTLEETAYFLDLTLDVPATVVVTGAMQNASAADWDGPRNLLDSVRVAADGRFRGMGALVCLAGEINAASEVSKTHTDEAGTFHSFDFGPLGTIQNGSVEFTRAPYHRDRIETDVIEERVALLKCYAGMSSRLFEHVVSDGAAGIVVEAMGVGNVPPGAFEGITYAIERGVVVALVSRCPIGHTQDVYSYYGAGKNLKRIGVMFADYLNGQKARIKLIAALGKTRDQRELRALFEWAQRQPGTARETLAANPPFKC